MKYKYLDRFLDEHFIPNHTIYKKTTDDIEDMKYEKYINLYNISVLKLSDEEKNYIIDYLKERGISVQGRTSSMNFESDSYIDTRNPAGGIKPKALTKEETDEKFRLYNETHDQKIREEIILGNMRLVWHVLRHMNFDYNLDQYDLLQNGYEGLVCAVDRFDPSKGLAFSTYATKYIDGYIRDEMHAQQGIRPSDIPLFRIMKSLEKEFGESINDNPSLAEKVVDRIVDKGLRSENYKKENLRRIMMMSTISLDEELEKNEDEEIYPLGYEIIDSDISYLYDEELKDTIQKELEKLPEKERKILSMRFGLNGEEPHTFQEIGNEIGMTSYGINLNVKSTCEKLSKKPKVRFMKNYSYKDL